MYNIRFSFKCFLYCFFHPIKTIRGYLTLTRYITSCDLRFKDHVLSNIYDSEESDASIINLSELQNGYKNQA